MRCTAGLGLEYKTEIKKQETQLFRTVRTSSTIHSTASRRHCPKLGLDRELVCRFCDCDRY
ncbi:MAG: hypothetical protein DWH98_06885 [Planctomycetota bacterium]|nr:MAG: hypothetical protein DWH98_06885 [Planctomycetota bacterium]